MKNFVLFFILSILLLNSISAQTDVKNWENVLWNSTTEQIKVKFQDKLIKLEKRENYDGFYCDYILKNFQAFNSDFSVHFIMEPTTNSLNHVLLKSNKIKSDSKIDPNDGFKLYDDILKLMIIKYGEPNNSEIDDYSNHSDWYFNSSIVSLGFLHMESIDLLNFTISYKKVIQGFDFRQIKWGFTKEQVKASEQLTPILDENDIVGYESTIAGMKCLIGYVFVDNKLARSKYVFEEIHTNKNDYIVDYNKLKDLLNKKYGISTTKNDENWRNDLYKDDFQQRGFAISLGHLYYYSTWSTQKSKINLMLSGENYKIKLTIEYSSKQFKGLDEKTKEKEMLNNF